MNYEVVKEKLLRFYKILFYRIYPLDMYSKLNTIVFRKEYICYMIYILPDLKLEEIF